MRISQREIHKLYWRTGDRVSGVYCDVAFTGRLMDSSRPTPDYKNILFVVSLDQPIRVFGNDRDVIEIQTNSSNHIEFE